MLFNITQIASYQIADPNTRRVEIIVWCRTHPVDDYFIQTFGSVINTYIQRVSSKL